MKRTALALIISITPAIGLGKDVPLKWIPLDHLSRYERSLVKLDEVERVKDVKVARAALSQNTPEGAHDELCREMGDGV